MKYNIPTVNDLVGKICLNVVVNDDEVHFHLDDGSHYALRHHQNCCESVYLEDVSGDISDLIGLSLSIAEEISSDDVPPLNGGAESYTWTFYKFATIKGYVTFRWYGTSNGYYSESVSFDEVS